jgi:hypothetical protein
MSKLQNNYPEQDPHFLWMCWWFHASIQEVHSSWHEYHYCRYMKGDTAARNQKESCVAKYLREPLLMSDLKCASCLEYLFHHPMQCPCGDRLCGKCYQAKVEERYVRVRIWCEVLWRLVSNGKCVFQSQVHSVWLLVWSVSTEICQQLNVWLHIHMQWWIHVHLSPVWDRSVSCRVFQR